jgi:hypothetical protein
VQRLINALRDEKLIKKQSGRWVLTKLGIKEVKESGADLDEQDELAF